MRTSLLQTEVTFVGFDLKWLAIRQQRELNHRLGSLHKVGDEGPQCHSNAPHTVVLYTFADDPRDFGDPDAVREAPNHAHLHLEWSGFVQQACAVAGCRAFLTTFPPASNDRRAGSLFQFAPGLSRTYRETTQKG